LLLKILEPTIAAFEEELRETDMRGRTLLHKWLNQVGCDAAAFLTIKTLLGQTTTPGNLNKLAPTLSRICADEVRYQRLRIEHRGLFEYRMNKFNTSNYRHKAASLNQTARYAGIEDEAMTDKDAILLGVKLINLCVGATGIGSFEVEKRKTNGKWITIKKFVLSEEVVTLLEDTNLKLQFANPQCLPMVVEPLPWSVELNGGYHYALRGRYPLIRKTTGKRGRDADMPFVYEGLNRIQATPWRINERLLGVVRSLRRLGSSLGGLPDAEPQPAPATHPWMDERIPKCDQTDEQKEQLVEWKKQASRIKEGNNLRASKLIEWLTAINLADQFVGYERIWFPHNLDFRGRAYPICSGLQPQGSDLQRGLLVFADPKPLGERGAYWLAVHGANTLGEHHGIKFSKQSFDQRVQWIHANSESICEVAADPIGHHWWSDADEPFQFLAFCQEWDIYVQASAAGRGDDYRSALPVGQDGTCNGLQHFAALLRDRPGGEAVNLTRQPLPNDVYDRIHRVVRTSLVKENASGVAEAKWWLDSGHLTRSLFKRPTMTFAYGSKTFGMTRQLIESLADNPHPDLEPMCRYLSKQIWSALEEVVTAAFGGMQWLADCAAAVVPVAGAVEWTVPVTGFPARQEYWNTTRHMVKTTLCGQAIRLSTYRETKEPLLYRHKNAIAPNVIHSLDAAALMMATVLASIEDVTHFGMVHDCYATHACDVEKLALATREGFIQLYDTVDVADDLHRQFSLVAETPRPPPKGDLNVWEVRSSPYFFS
jgi:DNA-directed RNA polymerase